MAFELRYINVFDDITSANQKDIQEFFAISNIVVESQMPSPSYDESQTLNNSLMRVVNFSSDEIENHIKQYAGIGNEAAKIVGDSISTELRYVVSNSNRMKSAYAKIAYWIKSIFSTALNGDKNVFIATPLGSLELYTVYLMSKFSNNIVLIDYSFNQDNYKLYNNMNFSITGTKEHLTYKPKPNITLDQLIENVTQDEIKIPSAKIMIIGEDAGGKLNNYLISVNSKQGKIKILTNGFEKPTFDEINAIPKPSASSTEQLVKRIGTHMFNSRANAKYADAASNFAKSTFEHELNYNKALSRLTEFICYFNKYKLDSDAYIVYGKVNATEATFINFVCGIGKVVIVVDTEGNSNINLSDWAEITLENKVNYHPYPVIAQNNTITYTASREIDSLMYDGSNLGLYRDRQFKSCSITMLNTTFDEMLLLWKEQNVVKPNFESKDSESVVPVFFSAVTGTCEDYILKLRQLVTDHTIVCTSPSEIMAGWKNKVQINHNVCITDTLYSERVPMYSNKKLDIKAIMGYKNFPYAYLSPDVQHHILSKLAIIAENDLINRGNMKEEAFIDLLLNVGLNLSDTILQYMQWYDYPKQSPKMVVISTEQEVITIEQAIVLELLHLCGWDIAVAIPTCYNVLGNFKGKQFQEFILGEPKFDVHIDSLEPYTPTEKKKGFFSRLFG